MRHASRSDCCVGQNSLNISVSDPILILKLAILKKNLICIRHRTYTYWIHTHIISSIAGVFFFIREKIVMTGSSHEENEEFCKKLEVYASNTGLAVIRAVQYYVSY